MVDFIDVWDIATFDDGLLAKLHAHANLVGDFLAKELELSTDRDAIGLTGRYRINPYWENYNNFLEDDLSRCMEARTIRAWHYTRLTNSEVEMLRNDGIQLSTLDRIRQRLDAQVNAGKLSIEDANEILLTSPFYKQADVRSNKFCMTSNPVEVKSDDVDLLLKHWGGEGVYFWLEDPRLIEIVAGIGKARVLEIAVPLDTTDIFDPYRAAKSVLATFARSLGCIPDFAGFDLRATHTLGPEVILAVHTEGEATFDQIGRGYPINFRLLGE